MALRKIIDFIPDLYKPFLPEVFTTEIPPEPFSDCQNCPMTSSTLDEMDDDLSKPFTPDTKCCTFTPRLPNYVAGAILSDSDPAIEEGKRRLQERIRAGRGIYPNGVYPTPAYARLYNERAPREFGRNSDLLCPYFTEGEYNCSIWKYREAICAFWFCKHLAATAGREFWKAVIDYMKYMQESLINISAYRCGLEPVDPYGEGNRPGYTESTDASEAEKKYAGLWKAWAGHETGYYIKCYEIVTGLEHENIRKIQMQAVPLAVKIDSIAHDIARIPEYLKLEKKAVDDDSEGFYRVEIKNYIEILQKSIVWSFRLPCVILDPFDGTRTTPEVVQQVLENHKIRIEPEILIALFRHGVFKDMKA
jgi:hypothetical protein